MKVTLMVLNKFLFTAHRAQREELDAILAVFEVSTYAS